MNSKVDPEGNKGTRILAATPFDFVTKVLPFRPAIAPDQKAGIQLMQDTIARAQDTAQYKAFVASKDIEGAKKFINTAVKEAFDDAARNASNPSSPYALPGVEQILQNIPGLQDLALSRKVLAPAIQAKVPLPSPSTVYNLGLAAVQKGELSLNQLATDMSVIYKAAQLQNIESKQLVGMGIAPIAQYNVKINNGDLLDKKVNIS